MPPPKKDVHDLHRALTLSARGPTNANESHRPDPPAEPAVFVNPPPVVPWTRRNFGLQVGPLLISGYVDPVLRHVFLDISFRPRGFSTDLAYASPIYRTAHVFPLLPTPDPGTARPRPSVSAVLTANQLFPVNGWVTGTAIWCTVETHPGHHVQQHWFVIGYDVTVQEPHNVYVGAATPYGPQVRLEGSRYAVQL